MNLYFDNSATTKPLDSVIEAMAENMRNFWGNPSSLHTKGYEAEKEISKAREVILGALNIRQRNAELFFTASGTEADNLALFGTMHSKEKNKGKKLITTKSEHPAVLNCAKQLEKEGYEVVYLDAPKGVINIEQYINALDKNTVMVSIMTVNNETGACYDIKKLFSMAKAISPETVTHTDAVQAFMKIRLSPEALKADLVSVSAHKIHGPKGIGALYVSPEMIKTKRITPHILGGGQEKGYRSGTENLPAIIGFAKAAEAGILPESVSRIKEYIINNLPKEIRANIPACPAPHILNITLPDIKSETMLHFLSSKGIYVSSGSACSSNSSHSNYVLPDFGISQKEADHSIRISLSFDHTKEDADILLNALNEGLNTLVRTNHSNR
ncbi:MAG: cysteine desulfurase [Clostridia bacterium]|nr:cysteine desulfurase [Clostridia bacterium]